MVCSSCFSSFACTVMPNASPALIAAAVTRFFAFISFLTIGFSVSFETDCSSAGKNCEKTQRRGVSGRIRQASALCFVIFNQLHGLGLKSILCRVDGADGLRKRLLL